VSDYPYNYELQNKSSVKQLNVVVDFGEGKAFSLVQTYKKIRYGEDNIRYGDPGLVYGGLIPIPGLKAIISPNSNMVISQKIEPEQGRGSAGTYSMEFVDKDGFMTEFVTPGKSFSQIMGGRLVKIYLGYANTSYPEDYFVVFRGYVSSINIAATKVILQFTDANLKRRQQNFFLGKGLVYSAVKTFAPGDVNVGTDTITVTAHGYTQDTKVTFGSDTALPGGIEFGTEYYVKPTGANTFQLSTAWDGPTLDITSTGAGVLQVTASKIVGNLGFEFDPASVDTVADKITIQNHGFIQDRELVFSTSGVGIGGLVLGQTYYAQVLDPNNFQLSQTPSGLIVDLTSQGIGKQQVFIANAPTSPIKIPMAKTDGFAKQILGPDGTYDTSVKTYIKINDEFLEYGPGDVLTDGIIATRGARGSKIGEINFDDDVSNYVELTGNPIDLALKIMLSGWAGPNQTGKAISGFNLTGLANPLSFPNAIILPDKVNAVEDYGLAVGSYMFVTDPDFGNTGAFTVRAFGDLAGYPNKVVFVNETVNSGRPTTATFDIRSQYDTLPINCGTKLKTYDVDVARWQDTKISFLFQSDNTMRILQSEPIASKDLIEKELLLPCGAYSVTRFGRLSVTITKPPIIDGRSIFLNKSNIVQPQNIQVMQALNNRTFFNEVQYQYNVNDAGEFTDTLSKIDTDSLSEEVGFAVSSVLPIQSRGLHSDLGAESFIDRRGLYLLRRYKDAAVTIRLSTNWQASSLIEVGDVVPVYDNGDLHISNLQDGSRDLGAQLFEVWERSLDMKSGTATLLLATQLGYQIDDRFATISPSTLTDIGSSTSRIKIKDSFGALYPGNEKRKWDGFEGETVWFHSYDCTTLSEYKTFLGFDPGDPYAMLVDPPFSTPPPPDTIIDIDLYSEVSAAVGQKYKIAFAHIDPTLTVDSGLSTTVFDVAPGDGAKMTAGLSIFVRKADWSQVSIEAKVDSVMGDTVTLQTAIDFVPAAGDKVELVGFIDGGGAYRIL